MQRLDFNTGWHFSCPDGRDFDVTLPHDAMLNTTQYRAGVYMVSAGRLARQRLYLYKESAHHVGTYK